MEHEVYEREMLTSEKSMAGKRARYSVMLLLLSQGWTPCIEARGNGDQTKKKTLQVCSSAKKKVLVRTKRSLQASTARNGGQFKLETAGRPAFSTISGGTLTPLLQLSPPKTPTAVCMVL